MHTILRGTTGASRCAESSGTWLNFSVAGFVQGSSSKDGRRHSNQSFPDFSFISPYCGPEFVWKRQYFMVNGLRLLLGQRFLDFGRVRALVSLVIAGAH